MSLSHEGTIMSALRTGLFRLGVLPLILVAIGCSGGGEAELNGASEGQPGTELGIYAPAQHPLSRYNRA
jgi:hypothetical protein